MGMPTSTGLPLLLLLLSRIAWSSGPSPAVAAARSAWKQYSLNDLLSWTQSSTDLYVRLLLPAGGTGGTCWAEGFVSEVS